MTKLTLKQVEAREIPPVAIELGKRDPLTKEGNKYFLLLNIQAEIALVKAQLNKLLEEVGKL